MVTEHQPVPLGLTVYLFPGGHVLIHTAKFEEEADDAQHCQKVREKVQRRLCGQFVSYLFPSTHSFCPAVYCIIRWCQHW